MNIPVVIVSKYGRPISTIKTDDILNAKATFVWESRKFGFSPDSYAIEQGFISNGVDSVKIGWAKP